MRIARVIGSVTLSKCHPSMDGYRLRCVEAADTPEQIGQDTFGTETQVAWDLMNAGEGQLVALAEGPESAAPFRPEVKPLDASIVALLDDIQV